MTETLFQYGSIPADVPTFARSGTGKWHIVGSDDCRYGEGFAADTAPDEEVTETDIIAYDPPDEPDKTTRSSVSITLSTGGSSFPRGAPNQQRLVLPSTIDETTGLCGSCQSTLERQQRRRSKVITGLKFVTTRRDVEWIQTDQATPQACDWCRATEETTYEGFNARVCPACQRLFETAFGEPSDDAAPDMDRLPEPPADTITPIVFGTTLPEYTPTDLVGSNRPLIKYREKDKYADIVFELERTGHGFTAEGIDALAAIQAEYADSVADTDAHQTAVSLQPGMTPRTVTLEGILPADHVDIITSCWGIVSDPDYWFPLGWPQQGYIHRREANPSIPGDVPVGDEFPRLETQEPSDGVDTETLRSVTDPGRFGRGERYYNRGAVTDIERIDDRINATVQGSRPYDVEVTLSAGSYVEGECSCPDDAPTCKHIVAAVLASGDVDDAGGDQSVSGLLETADADELHSFLETLADEHIEVRKRIYEEFS